MGTWFCSFLHGISVQDTVHTPTPVRLAILPISLTQAFKYWIRPSQKAWGPPSPPPQKKKKSLSSSNLASGFGSLGYSQGTLSSFALQPGGLETSLFFLKMLSFWHNHMTPEAGVRQIKSWKLATLDHLKKLKLICIFASALPFLVAARRGTEGNLPRNPHSYGA